MAPCLLWAGRCLMKKYAVCLAILTLSLPGLQSASVRLQWDANLEPDLAGYRVYWGPATMKMQRVEAGLATDITISGLLAGTTYRFYATAYNIDNLESVPSAELLYYVPNPAPDTDRDGLPDAYEIAHRLNPLDAGDSSEDSDGDGLSNLDEFFIGSNPLSAASHFAITGVTGRNGATFVQFTSAADKIYVLEANDEFPHGPWLPVSFVGGTGSLTEVPDFSARDSARRIYRVITTGFQGRIIATAPAGFHDLFLLGDSDTCASVPLLRPAVFTGRAASLFGNNLQASHVMWENNQFVYAGETQSNTFFVLIRGGAREGDFFTITGNTFNSLSLDPGPASLEGIAPGVPFSIHPYWTLGTIFPGGEGVHESPSPAARHTEVLVPDVSARGTRSSTAHTYYFINGVWREVGQGAAVKNDDVILPDMFFWVRHHLEAPTVLTIRGAALESKWRFTIRRLPSGRQDNLIALPRPDAVSLNTSGLIESGAFRPSQGLASRGDEILVFENAARGRNKSASATYFFVNGGWRRVGMGLYDSGDDIVFTPGSGLILRAAEGYADSLWVSETGLKAFPVFPSLD